MRVKHTLMNISAGLVNQLIITLLSFVSRTVFISSLGVEYLGVNALFTSVLAMLSLAEAGIGSSIIYNLYKPVAEQDQPKILALMRLYRNAYRFIALFVFLLGIAVLPFLGMLVPDSNVAHMEWVYLIFLMNTVIPYLFVYKQNYLNVNQKNYIVTLTYSGASIASTSIRIAILYYTENYILYLAVDSVITIITSIWLAHFVNRKYPFLRTKSSQKLDPDTKKSFIKNMKAICIQNIGNYFVFGVESILISMFISIVAVGLYANYKMLIDICRTFINQVFANMYHSVGNLVASESSDTVYRVYKATQLLSFWLYSLCAAGLYLLINPLIVLWIGRDYLLDELVLLVLVLLFYERGMRNPITTVKTTAGIFHEDRYAPLLQAAINVAASLLLVRHLGLSGIFIGGFISTVAVPFWTTPYLVYKKVFNKPLIRYYVTYFYYTSAGLAALAASYGACLFIPDDSITQLALRGVICIAVVNAMYVLLFLRTKEFHYLLRIFFAFMKKLPGAQIYIRKFAKARLTDIQ